MGLGGRQPGGLRMLFIYASTHFMLLIVIHFMLCPASRVPVRRSLQRWVFGSGFGGWI